MIGIVEDFHYASLHNEIGPMIIGVYSSNFRLLGMNHLSVKFSGKNYQEVLQTIGESWDKIYPGLPFNASFLDESFRSKYDNELKLTQIIGGFAGLAIFIACLGLFGLAIHLTQSRTKEIGIRKVMGAGVKDIVIKLTSNFWTLILIGNFLSWPIVYWAMKKWLDDFAYHIDIGWTVFVGAGLASLMIALITIGYRTLKAALENPVNALRYE